MGLDKLVVHPNSLKRRCWDCLACLTTILIDIFLTPMLVFHTDGQLPFITTVSYFTRFFWVADFIISLFLTGFYMKSGNVEMRSARIAAHYARTWMVFDLTLVLCLWLEVILDSTSMFGWSNIGIFFRRSQILRIVRLSKFTYIFDELCHHTLTERQVLSISISKIVLVIIAIVHLMGCTWFWLGTPSTMVKSLGDTMDMEFEETWVTEFGLQNRTSNYQYWTSVHWAMLSLVGDSSHAVNTREHAFTVLALLFGFLIATFTVSSITSSVTCIFQDARNLHLLKMRRFLHDKKVPAGLAHKIRDNIEVSIRRAPEDDEVQDITLFDKLAEPLMEELCVHMYWQVLKKHPFFSGYQTFIRAGHTKQTGMMLMKGPAHMICRNAVTTLKVRAGSILFNAGETAETPKMFFLASGEMDYAKAMGSSEDQLISPGAWICEASLWAAWIHLGTLRARTDCTLLVVHGEKLQKVVKTSIQSEVVITYAECYMQALKGTMVTELTDLGTKPDSKEIASRVFVGTDCRRKGIVAIQPI